MIIFPFAHAAGMMDADEWGGMMPGYGLGGMMGGYGFFGVIIWILAAAFLIAGIYYFVKRANKK